MKCILNCFKKGILKILGKIKKVVLTKIPEKDNGFSRIKVIMFYLEYVDKFTPKNKIRFLMLRLSLILKVLQKVIWMNVHYKIENYSNIAISESNWNSYIDLIYKIETYDLKQKRKAKFTTQAIEVLIYDAFYGRGVNSKDVAFKDIEKITGILELPNSSITTQEYILDCARYIFNISNTIPSLEIVDDRLNTFQLIALERVSLMLGFISSSYLFKEKAREKYIQNFYLANDKSLATIKNAFFSALEIGDYETMKNIVVIAKKELENQKVVNILDYLYQLFTNQEYTSVFSKLLNEDEIAFSDFVKNKSVAIVAPLPVKTQLGELIDSHDYILRTGTVSHPDYLDSKIYGSRTDITSTNIADILGSKIFKDGRLSIDKNLKYLLFRNLESTPIKNHKFSIPVVKKRTVSSRDYILTGILNHVPELVLFLLGSGVSKISLFSMNFFMSNNAYNKRYRSGSTTAHNLYFIGDNLASGHIYLKRLYELELVELDENALEVIKLSTEEYIQNIENIYRDTIRRDDEGKECTA